jgi:hypothetical protein
MHGDKSDLYNHLPENQLYIMLKRMGNEFTDEGTEEEPEGEVACVTSDHLASVKPLRTH